VASVIVGAGLTAFSFLFTYNLDLFSGAITGNGLPFAFLEAYRMFACAGV
jgi:hypothetical protein